ncbi:MAG: HEAT repeat domain-containing protein, partial [Deltaproteobacteria bacterium]|nr:HEAT repeat domain-containing protein [Deltaproteobacteria bacterium]
MLVALATVSTSWAQNKQSQVTELVQLLSKQPDGMDVIEWKEKRRDAARKLGDLGDTRAVPTLIKVVEKEEFDVVGEFAIEALGKLGDDRAVEVLRRVAANPARDRDQRKAARKALKRLGTSATGGGGSGGGKT